MIAYVLDVSCCCAYPIASVQTRGIAKAALRVSVAPALPLLLILDGSTLGQLVSNALLLGIRHASTAGDSIDVVAYRAEEPLAMPAPGADADGSVDVGTPPVRRVASHRAARAGLLPSAQPGASASVGQGELVVELICCHGTGGVPAKEETLASVDAAQQQPHGARARPAGVFLPIARALTASMDGSVTMDERTIQTMIPQHGGPSLAGDALPPMPADAANMPVLTASSGRISAADARAIASIGEGLPSGRAASLPGTAPQHWQLAQQRMATTALLRIRLRVKFTEPSDAEARKARDTAVAAAAGSSSMLSMAGHTVDGGNTSPRFEALEAQDVNASAPLPYPAAVMTGCALFQGPRRGLPGPGWATVRLPDGSWAVGPMGAVDSTPSAGTSTPVTPAPGLLPPTSAGTSAGTSRPSAVDFSGFVGTASMAPVPRLLPRTAVPPPSVPQVPITAAAGAGSDDEDIVISSTGAPLTPAPATGPSLISARRPPAATSVPVPLASSTAASRAGGNVVGLDGQPLRMHVLLVDDAAVIRRQGKLFLEQLGCTCVTLEDGACAKAQQGRSVADTENLYIHLSIHLPIA